MVENVNRLLVNLFCVLEIKTVLKLMKWELNFYRNLAWAENGKSARGMRLPKIIYSDLFQISSLVCFANSSVGSECVGDVSQVIIHPILLSSPVHHELQRLPFMGQLCTLTEPSFIIQSFILWSLNLYQDGYGIR